MNIFIKISRIFLPAVAAMMAVAYLLTGELDTGMFFLICGGGYIAWATDTTEERKTRKHVNDILRGE